MSSKSEAAVRFHHPRPALDLVTDARNGRVAIWDPSRPTAGHWINIDEDCLEAVRP